MGDESFILFHRKFLFGAEVVGSDLFGLGRRKLGCGQANYQYSAVGVCECRDIFSKFVVAVGSRKVIRISSLSFKPCVLIEADKGVIGMAFKNRFYRFE